jgi:hypothetical protein
MPRAIPKFLITTLLAASMVTVSTAADAQVLIINGASGTSEPSTTAAITTNLTNLFNAIGVNPTVVDGVPASLAGFSQVWDIRFSNNFALGATDQSLYLGFLQGGGGMFVMGENSNFMTRNNSVLALISAAGGGNLGFVVPTQTQTVHAPFNQPNPVSQVTYAAAGGVDGTGTGQWITSNAAGTQGSGVAFGVGTLANAQLGALTTIFDVNFMMNTYGPDVQNLTKNLVGFVEDQVPTPPSVVPEPMSMVLLGTGLVGIVAARRRRRTDEA